MICKFCNHEQPDPPPIVTAKIKEVLKDPVLYVAKWAAFAIMFVAACIAVHYMHEDYVLAQIAKEQSVKIEITEYDANGRPHKKLSR